MLWFLINLENVLSDDINLVHLGSAHQVVHQDQVFLD